MFSLNRKIKHQDSESIPVHKEDVARLAISADGERVFTKIGRASCRERV